jgi:hypothetical protein
MLFTDLILIPIICVTTYFIHGMIVHSSIGFAGTTYVYTPYTQYKVKGITRQAHYPLIHTRYI